MSICVAICNLGLAFVAKVIHGEIKQGSSLADNRFVIGRLGVRVSPPAPLARPLRHTVAGGSSDDTSEADYHRSR